MSISTALDRRYHAHIDHTLCGQEFDKPIASCVKSEQGQWDIVGFQVISLHKTRISYLIHSKSDIHEQKEAQHAYFLKKRGGRSFTRKLLGNGIFCPQGVWSIYEALIGQSFCGIPLYCSVVFDKSNTAVWEIKTD